MRLEDKVAIVTGGGSGIGAATVELFAREGARVVFGDLNEEAGNATLKRVLAAGGDAVFIPTDVSNEQQMERLVGGAVERFGYIDIIHNNAGGSTLNDGPITSISNDEFWLKMRVDVFGTWLGCRLAIPHMIQRGGGSIINMTSIHGIIGRKDRNAYSAAKGAVISLTRALAVQYGENNIRVNCIAPGRTLTERVLSREKERQATETGGNGHLLGLIDPIDVAQTALHLASNESRRTTGQVVVVDSGLTVQ